MRFLPPFLFNLTGIIDTFLVKFFGKEEDEWMLHDGIGTLMIIGWCVAGLIAISFLPRVYTHAFSLSVKALIFLLVGWISYGIAAFPYFKALNHEQIENISPMYQIIPFFTYILGVVFLREIVSRQILLCIIGVIILTSLFYFNFSTFRLNKKALLLTSLSALLYSISFIFFKVGGLAEGNFLVALFWEHIGVFLVGFYFFLSNRTRNSTRIFLKTSWRKFSILNLFNELFFIVGIILLNYLSFSHYVVIVWILSNGIQPMLAFPMKYIAHRLKPQRYDRNYTRKQILTKAVLIIVLFAAVGYISLHIK